MRNIFFITSVIIFLYLIYYQVAYLSSFVFMEEGQFRHFTEVFPMAYAQEGMMGIRFTHLLLSLLSAITFLLYIKRSRGSKSSKNVVKVVLALNCVIILLCGWQVVAAA